MLALFSCISALFLFRVSDVFNKVVLDNVIRKIKGDTQLFFSYLFTFEVFVFLFMAHAKKLRM